jgi:hypothetical protein
MLCCGADSAIACSEVGLTVCLLNTTVQDLHNTLSMHCHVLFKLQGSEQRSVTRCVTPRQGSSTITGRDRQCRGKKATGSHAIITFSNRSGIKASTAFSIASGTSLSR